MKNSKVLSIFLAMVMIFSCVPMAAFADSSMVISEIIVPVSETCLTPRVTAPVFYDSLNAVTESGDTVVLDGLTWVADKTYDIADKGVYTFTIDASSVTDYTVSDEVIAAASIRAELVSGVVTFSDGALVAGGIPVRLSSYGDEIVSDSTEDEGSSAAMAVYDKTGCNVIYTENTNIARNVDVFGAVSTGGHIGNTLIDAQYGGAGNIYGGSYNGSRVTGDAYINVGSAFVVSGDVYGGSYSGTFDGDVYITVAENSKVEGTIYAGGLNSVVTGTTYIDIGEGASVGAIKLGNAANVVLRVTSEFDYSVVDTTMNAYNESFTAYVNGEEIEFVSAAKASVSSMSIGGGIQISDINFPATVTATTASGSKTIDVTWECDNYDSSTAGTYVFRPVLGDGYWFETSATVPSISVKVAKTVDVVDRFILPVSHTYFLKSLPVETPTFYPSLQAVTTKGEVVTVSGLKWTAVSSYDSATEGDYMFKIDATSATGAAVPDDVVDNADNQIKVTVLGVGWGNQVGYFKSNGATVIPVAVIGSTNSNPNYLYDITGYNLLRTATVSTNLKIAGGGGYKSATAAGDATTAGQTAEVAISNDANLEAAIAGGVAKDFSGTAYLTVDGSTAARVITGNVNSAFSGESVVTLKNDAAITTLYLGSVYDTGAIASSSNKTVLGSEDAVAFSGTTTLRLDSSFTGSIGSVVMGTADKVVIDVPDSTYLSYIPSDIQAASNVTIALNGVLQYSVTGVESSVTSLSVGYETTEENIELPETVTVTVNGEAAEIAVAGWTSADYDSSTPGSYVFTPVLPDGYVLVEGAATGAVTVTVNALDGIAVTALTIPVKNAYYTVVSSTKTFYEYDTPTYYSELKATLSNGETVTLSGLKWVSEDFDFTTVGSYTFSVDPSTVKDYYISDKVLAKYVITAHVVEEQITYISSTVYLNGISCVLRSADSTGASWFAYDNTGLNKLPVFKNGNATPILTARTAKNVYGGTNNSGDITSGYRVVLEGLSLSTVYLGSKSNDITGTMTLIADDCTFAGTVYSGSYDGDINGNVSATFSNCTFNSNYIGSVRRGLHSGTATTTMNNCTVSGNLYAGCNERGSETKKAVLSLNGGTYPNVYGGAVNGILYYTTVNVTGAKITNLYGGGAGNYSYVYQTTLNMNSGTATNIFGGAYRCNGDVYDAILNINGGTISKIYPRGNVAGTGIDASGTGIVKHLAKVVAGSSYVSKLKYNSDDAYFVMVNGTRQGSLDYSLSANGATAEATYSSVTLYSDYLGTGKKYVFCNGIPVVIKKASDGLTYLYNESGTKLLSGNIDDANIVGGGLQKNVASTKITMNSGIVNNIYGGGCASDVSGQVKVIVNGGNVRGQLYLGSGNYYDRKASVGSIYFELNGGTVKNAFVNDIGVVGTSSSTGTTTTIKITGGIVQTINLAPQNGTSIADNRAYGDVNMTMSGGRVRFISFSSSHGLMYRAGDVNIKITGGTLEEGINNLGDTAYYAPLSYDFNLTVPSNFDMGMVYGKLAPNMTVTYGSGTYVYESVDTTMLQDRAAVLDTSDDTGLTIRPLAIYRGEEYREQPTAQYLAGDAIYITFPNGANMLVDTGYADSNPTLFALLDEMGVDTIDYLVITHYHSDHTGGVATVIENYAIKTVIVPALTYTTAYTHYDNVMNSITSSMTLKKMKKNDTLSIGGVTIRALNPDASYSQPADYYTETVANNLGLVLRMDYGSDSVLLTADIYDATENSLLSNMSGYLDVDLLKLGHHGHTSSSGIDFVKKCSPEYIFITNNYANFSGMQITKSILENYANCSQDMMYSTGEYGSMKFELTGSGINVATEYFDMTEDDVADYSAVEAAKEKVPSDLTIYTDETVAALKYAVNSVTYGYSVQYQTRVDEMAQNILTAIANLETKAADYSDVEVLLCAVPTEDEYKYYTEASIADVNDAVSAIVYDLDYTKQSVVDGYASTLKTALDNLTEVFVEADYSLVEAALATVPADLSGYTAESAAAVTAAVNAVVYGLSYKEQVTVNGYATAINEAVSMLDTVVSGADYSRVEAALATVPADLTCYTTASKARINKAVNAVVYGLTSEQQATVDGYASAITLAVSQATAAHSMAEEVIAATPEAQGYTRHYCENCTYEYCDTYTDYVGGSEAIVLTDDLVNYRLRCTTAVVDGNLVLTANPAGSSSMKVRLGNVPEGAVVAIAQANSYVSMSGNIITVNKPDFGKVEVPMTITSAEGAVTEFVLVGDFGTPVTYMLRSSFVHSGNSITFTSGSANCYIGFEGTLSVKSASRNMLGRYTVSGKYIRFYNPVYDNGEFVIEVTETDGTVTEYNVTVVFDTTDYSPLTSTLRATYAVDGDTVTVTADAGVSNVYLVIGKYYSETLSIDGADENENVYDEDGNYLVKHIQSRGWRVYKSASPIEFDMVYDATSAGGDAVTRHFVINF